MTAFIVATVTITDPVKFKAYGEAIAGLGEQFGGEYLVRGPVQEVLEGDSVIGERVVVLRFPDADTARAFYNSPTYQAGKALREGGAVLTMRIIAG